MGPLWPSGSHFPVFLKNESSGGVSGKKKESPSSEERVSDETKQKRLHVYRSMCPRTPQKLAVQR